MARDFPTTCSIDAGARCAQNKLLRDGKTAMKILKDTAYKLVGELLWADRSERRQLQDFGVNVVPANFYSAVPSISEIESSYEYAGEDPPYLNDRIFNSATIHRTLEELIPYAADFSPPEDGDEVNGTSYFWRNSQFSFSDAMSYWAFIRKTRPKTVLEIGCGFSSLIALEALNANGAGKLHGIEPFPRPFVSRLASDGAFALEQRPAQTVDPEWANSILQDGDILFIDSTHTVKTGSDCLHIYLRLLPMIRRKILVHVHDIFLPFGMPKEWLLDMHIHWTEQFLLLALLTDNPRTRVLYGSAYNDHFNKKLLSEFMHGKFGQGGGSFWFEYDGTR
jgi:hypothetical protein